MQYIHPLLFPLPIAVPIPLPTRISAAVGSVRTASSTWCNYINLPGRAVSATVPETACSRSRSLLAASTRTDTSGCSALYRPSRPILPLAARRPTWRTAPGSLGVIRAAGVCMFNFRDRTCFLPSAARMPPSVGRSDEKLRYVSDIAHFFLQIIKPLLQLIARLRRPNLAQRRHYDCERLPVQVALQ